MQGVLEQKRNKVSIINSQRMNRSIFLLLYALEAFFPLFLSANRCDSKRQHKGMMSKILSEAKSFF